MFSNVLLKLLAFILMPKHPALQQPDDLSWNNIIIPNADVFNIYSGMIANQLDNVIDSMTHMWALMIVAPTGSGKTTLVRKIIKKVRKAHGKLLYISNRLANSVSFKISLAYQLEDFAAITKLNKFKKYGDLDLISDLSVIGPVTILTYQSAVRQFGINFTNDRELKFDWVVMDEINFYSSDSTFNAASLDCLNLVVPKFANACRVYLSATPEAVLPSIAETEKEILAFHVHFERIFPFEDGNGRIGRLVMFKECLRYGIMPFILDDKRRTVYLQGIRDWDKKPATLLGVVAESQERFRRQIELQSLGEYRENLFNQDEEEWDDED